MNAMAKNKTQLMPPGNSPEKPDRPIMIIALAFTECSYTCIRSLNPLSLWGSNDHDPYYTEEKTKAEAMICHCPRSDS
jgi:hypothetical protein